MILNPSSRYSASVKGEEVSTDDDATQINTTTMNLANNMTLPTVNCQLFVNHTCAIQNDEYCMHWIVRIAN